MVKRKCTPAEKILATPMIGNWVRTRQDSVHTAPHFETGQKCFEIFSHKQSCLVSNSVHTANTDRQDKAVLSCRCRRCELAITLCCVPVLRWLTFTQWTWSKDLFNLLLHYACLQRCISYHLHFLLKHFTDMCTGKQQVNKRYYWQCRILSDDLRVTQSGILINAVLILQEMSIQALWSTLSKRWFIAVVVISYTYLYFEGLLHFESFIFM